MLAATGRLASRRYGRSRAFECVRARRDAPQAIAILTAPPAPPAIRAAPAPLEMDPLPALGEGWVRATPTAPPLLLSSRHPARRPGRGSAPYAPPRRPSSRGTLRSRPPGDRGG